MLHDALHQVAREHPDAPALHLDEATLTFAQLDARVARATTVVRALAAPGTRVAVIGEGSFTWTDCLHAIPRAGCTLLFLNHRLAAPELVAIVRRAGAGTLIGAADELARVGGAFGPDAPLAVDDAAWEALVAGAVPAPASDVRGSEDDVAWLLYTSGTTGAPKGAMLSHATIAAAIDATTRARPATGDEVYLYPFPMGHIAAYNVVHRLGQGRPVVVLRRFDPAVLVQAVRRHEVTALSLAATMLAALLDHLDLTGEELPSVRTVAYGAAPMPPELLRRASARFADVEFAQGYGLTELSGNAVFLGPEAHRAGLAGDERLLRAAGWPAPGVEVAIVDASGRELPAGTPGEVVVRAAQVMVGYWEDPAATRAALDGGLHTGDLGRLDADGLLTVLDRIKDVIVTGGENVSSLEVEDVVRTHPDVAAVAVVGVPDPRWGQNVCAVVVPRPGATLDQAGLAAHVRARLAGFKVPRHVVLVDLLPVNAAGKVVKAELRSRLVADPTLLGPRG